MRRLVLPLVVCALLAACTAGPPPATSSYVPLPDWAPEILPPDADEPDGGESGGGGGSGGGSRGGGGGVGSADGAGAKKLTIYDAPRTTATCTMPEVVEGNRASMKRYLDEVSSCLDRIWSRELRAVNLLFLPPRRKYVPRRVDHPVCGPMPAKGADGTYCDAIQTYFILLDPAAPRRPWKAWAARLAAHEYGHHVQHLARILDYQTTMLEAAAAKKAKDLITRRLELQAECLSGVALHAMRTELPPWDEFQYLYTGTPPKRWILDHGRLDTQYRWMLRGFRSGKPGSCNTWSVAAKKVT